MNAAILALRDRARSAGKIDLARACTIVLEPDRHAAETVRLAAVDVEAALRPEADDEPTLPRTLTPQTARVELPTMDEIDQEWRAERAEKEDRRG